MIVCNKANAVFEKIKGEKLTVMTTQIYLAKLDNSVIDLVGELF